MSGGSPFIPMNIHRPNFLLFCAALFMAILAIPVLGQTAIRPGGLGTPGDPYRIRNVGELVWVGTTEGIAAQGLAAHYRLENDIDLIESRDWPGGLRPVGRSFQPFTGTLDGGGFAIRNLTIDRGGETGVGLFGAVGAAGFVHDLRIENASVTGNVRVGILAGLNWGTLSNCVVMGRVEGRSAVGGMTGENSSFASGFSSTTEGRLLRGSARVEVHGVHSVGGLAGINTGTIDGSFATGLVVSPVIGQGTGGLVGGNLHGVIQRSFSSSITRGGERVGGLVGLFSGNTNGLIRECFSVGPVTGRPGSTGGLVGHASPRARSEISYWDIGSSGQAGSAAGTGLDSATMRDPGQLTNWAVGTVWIAGPAGSLLRHAWAPPLVRVDVLSEGPGVVRLLGDHLQAQGSTAGIEAIVGATDAEFVGWRGAAISQPGALQTEVDFDIDQQVLAVFRYVHEIRTTAELRSIGREPGYTLSDRYRLMADLDFAGEPPMEPIGPDGTNSFVGVFEGNGHTLRNLRIGETNLSTSALFGWVGDRGEIRDLHLGEAEVVGRAKVAGIAAVNRGRIAGCTVAGRITGVDDVGGIVGINEGVIEDCISRGTVVGTDHVGGIAGYHVGGRITRPTFIGSVEGSPTSHAVGGICGWTDSAIVEGVSTAGTVSGSHFVGGVLGIFRRTDLTGFRGTNRVVSGRFATGGMVGSVRDATVTDSSTHGSVTSINAVGGAFGEAVRTAVHRVQADVQTVGTENVGGLVGYSRTSDWIEVVTAGRVNGDKRVGGWVGILDGGRVLDSQADAAVSGRRNVGGGVGQSFGNVSDSRTGGPVQGEENVGGLVGENWSGSIVRTHSTAPVHGVEAVGGLVGLNLGSLDASTASGNASGELFTGGLVGLNRNGGISRSSASGDVSALWAAGGLVGENFRGQITGAAASGQVSGDYRTGGLVGGNFGGTISGSVASGLLLGGNRAGGLVGENTVGGRIERSASGATVHGISEVGGLVGYNGDSTEIPRIVESLASGTVLGQGARIGGLVGFNEPGMLTRPTGVRGEVEGSYHLAGQGSSDSPPAGTPVSRAQLHQQATFVGWDFASDWTLAEGVSTPRPAWQTAALTLRVIVDGPGSVTVTPLKTSYVAGETVTLTAIPDSGFHRFRGWIGAENIPPGAPSIAVTLDGSRTLRVEFERVHTIRRVEELARIGRDPEFGLGDHYVLVDDIDASVTGTWNDEGTSGAVAGGFPPIGSETGPFTGTLDGQGHTIRQLQIRRSSEESVGLFAVIGRGARIHDLQMTNASVTGFRSVGIVAGNNWGGILDRIRVQGEAGGQQRVGLIAGVHQAAIGRSTASGTVTLDAGTQPAGIGGGAMGQADLAWVRDTHFTGGVTGALGAETAGGMVGEASRSQFRNVTSSGTVDAAFMVGGIAGRMEESELHSAWSTADVSAGVLSQSNGGLVGFASRSILSQSAFGGSVRAGNGVGGLVGQGFSLRIEDSFFSGSAGIAEVSIGVGGLIGQGDDFSISRSYVNGVITGQSSLWAISASGPGSFTADSVYWNEIGVGAGIPVDSMARSVEALRSPETFAGWNLDSIWVIDPQRNDGFPYLRHLPYSGLAVPMDALHVVGGPLLGWIAAHRSAWAVSDPGVIPAADLLTAYLLDREPTTGLRQRLQLELQHPWVGVDEVLIDADLTLDGQPVEGTLQGRWIIESASDPVGPWQRWDRTDPTPLVAGRTRFDLPIPDGNLFRVRIEPGLLR